MSDLIIEGTQFDTIWPIWKEKLWPERQSPIEAVSAINSRGEIEVSLMSAKPYFWIAKKNAKIIGVISGFQTRPQEFRSRGIWVDPANRKSKVGQSLIQTVEHQALKCSCSILWTMPRESAVGFYQKLGFIQSGQTDRFEYGPHLLMQKEVSLSPEILGE